MSREVQSVELDPTLFYSLVDLLAAVGPDELLNAQDAQESMIRYQDDLAGQIKELEESCRHLAHETRVLTRRKQTTAIEKLDAEESDAASGINFLGLVLAVVGEVNSALASVISTAAKLRPGRLILRKERFTAEPTNFSEIQHMVMEFQMNLPTINRFAGGVSELLDLKTQLLTLTHSITDTMEKYRRRVQHRHSAEGIEIFGSVVATDVAISIYANVDGHGEIEDGKKPDEVSAYSVRRAQAMADGVRSGLAQLFISKPEQFIDWLSGNLKAVWEYVESLQTIYKEATIAAQIVLPSLRKFREPTRSQLEEALLHLRDVDPNAVPYREKAVLLTAQERWHLNFRNATLKRLVELLRDEAFSPEDVIRYVLDRKHQLYDYFQGEHSFYVCRIGHGNTFLGEAPGALEVIPGPKPTVNLDEIFGSGYDDIRQHAEHIEAATKWHDLFVATSPSKTADKSNVLLVGPMGCGKSEVLRGIGSHRGSLGIYAVGSDFLTCWAGEAQKNPKRLFEAAVKLEKESRKRVHILIDEIDSVLNDDDRQGPSKLNLRLEFQILMDGVVHYPRITLWGATNNIERIPMPMIRRFSKIAIVGELDQTDRVRTLRHYASPLPQADYPDAAWEDQAKKLEGATGDVIRKVVDHVWREKMSAFVDNNPHEAEALVRWLNVGDKFSIDTFGGSGEVARNRRAEFKTLLGHHVTLTPVDVDRSIEIALDNVGIHNEIQTAVATYEGARRFLAQVRAARGAA